MAKVTKLPVVVLEIVPLWGCTTGLIFSGDLSQDSWNPVGSTCGHILQHLQQHVLGLINQLCSLHYQLPQAEIAIQDCAHQTALEVSFDGLYFHKGREKPYEKQERFRILGTLFALLAMNYTRLANLERCCEGKNKIKWPEVTPGVTYPTYSYINQKI